MNNEELTWNPEELDKTMLSFAEIQAEINYKKAQNALRDLVSNLDLTREEQAGLEAEIDHLAAMLDKLEQSVVQIVAFGMVGKGKSSVLNALLGQNVFSSGPLHGVTQTIESANWQISQENLGNSNQDIVKIALPSIGNSQIQLIDTPGIDEIDGENRELLACKIAQQADLILFIISGDITKIEYQAISRLRQLRKPILLVFNKIDRYPEADKLAIYHKIRDERVKELLSPKEIVMISAAPLVKKASQQADGSLKFKYCKAQPQIEELKLKIIEILHREGKSLIALNSMLYAGELNEKLVTRKMIIRGEAADRLIQKAVMAKAVAIAFNPVTAVDLFTGAVIDLGMILALSRLYGIPMNHQGAINLLQKIALSMGGISASELLASLGLSSLKGILGISAPLTAGVSLAPYISVAITQAGVGGVSCYAIGQITKAYLANGASWGEESPKTLVKRILDSLDETSILNRIKYELKAKIQ